MKPLSIALILFVALCLAYLAGPRTRKPRLDGVLPEAPDSPAAVEAWLQRREAAMPVRPDNQARVVWAGKPGQATELALVYFHGYSASWREGAPVNLNTAKRYGANLLLTRLHEHGLERPEALLDFDAETMWQDAKLALVQARVLGRKVVIMATSSGAPLALRLAGQHPELVDGLLLYSPNIEIRHRFSSLISGPWGLQIARLAKGGKYNEWVADEEVYKYWYRRQRLEGAAQLQALLDTSMSPAILAEVKCPVFIGAFYKDEKVQDETVSVAAIRRMLGQLGTPAAQRTYIEYPDAGSHVIACDLTSKAWPQIQADTWRFLDTVLAWQAR
jgi:pimeloyl-ACP methyl ester carboxylesterase